MVGVLAVLEGCVRAGQIDDYVATRLVARFARLGLLTDGAGTDCLPAALNSLNQRLRDTLGE